MLVAQKDSYAYSKKITYKGPARPPRKPGKGLDFKLKYKTEVCRNWEAGRCPYAHSCAFAHGYQELRNKQHLSKNYKRKPCKQFFSQGYCTYGERCQFAHNEVKTASHSADSSFSEPSPRQRLPVFVDLESRWNN